MSTAIKMATRIQVGKETTRGTAVAATRMILTKDATYRNLESLETFEGQMHGTLARTTVAPVITRNHTEFEISNDLDFEQVLLFLLSGMKGGVTPTTPGRGEARLWTFTPSVTADPLPDAYTIEFAERDMDASANELELEAPYGITTQIELSGGDEGVPQINASMVARKSVLSTSTPSLALPTITHPSNLQWAAYIDGKWAKLGTTQITGQIYGSTWRFGDFIKPVYYQDGRSALDFSNYEFGPRLAELSLDVVLDPASGGLVPTEDGNKSAGTLRFVRMQVTGSAFVSPDNGLSRFIQLDGAYYHAEDSMQERGGDRDGNVVTRVHLLSAYDSTQAQDVQVAVQNNLATFP